MEAVMNVPPLELELPYSSLIPPGVEPEACCSSLPPIPTTHAYLPYGERIRRMANIRIRPEYIDPVLAGVLTPDEMERTLRR